MPVHVREQVVLPVSVERAWAYLEDLTHVVELDPLLESYEPETGALREGTTNRVVSRLGPLRLRMVTRTVVFDPPHRAAFESVQPRWPLHVLTEDTLTDHPEGSRYEVATTVRGVGPLGRVFAGPVARRLMRTRRQLMDRIRRELAEGG